VGKIHFFEEYRFLREFRIYFGIRFWKSARARKTKVNSECQKSTQNEGDRHKGFSTKGV